MKTHNSLSKSLIFGLISMVILSLTSCFDDFNCIRGRGIIDTEERTHTDFNGVDLRVPAKLIVTQGPTFSIEIETFQNIQNEILTYVSGGTLVIENERCIQTHADEIIIYVTAPDFAKLRIFGSGSVESTNMLTVPDIDLYISGSGNIDVALTTAYVGSRISGSGKITIEGEADEHSSRIDGSGKIATYLMNTNRTDITISGSGNCEVFVQNNLDVDISGSGTVKYKGQPLITSKINGSGRIINAN